MFVTQMMRILLLKRHATNQEKLSKTIKSSLTNQTGLKTTKTFFHKERLSPPRVKPRATRKKHGEMSTTNRHGAGTLSHSLKIHPGPKTTKSTND